MMNRSRGEMSSWRGLDGAREHIWQNQIRSVKGETCQSPCGAGNGISSTQMTRILCSTHCNPPLPPNCSIVTSMNFKRSLQWISLDLIISPNCSYRPNPNPNYNVQCLLTPLSMNFYHTDERHNCMVPHLHCVKMTLHRPLICADPPPCGWESAVSLLQQLTLWYATPHRAKAPIDAII